MPDPLEPHERAGLTIWTDHFAAQVQQFNHMGGEAYQVLALNLARAEEDHDGCRLLDLADILKLRALLNEAAVRFGWPPIDRDPSAMHSATSSGITEAGQ